MPRQVDLVHLLTTPTTLLHLLGVREASYAGWVGEQQTNDDELAPARDIMCVTLPFRCEKCASIVTLVPVS
jgi:hypothetical protein